MSIINDALKKTQQQRQQVKLQKSKIQVSSVMNKPTVTSATESTAKTIVNHHYTAPWRAILYLAGLGFMCIIPFLSYQRYQQASPKPHVALPVIAKVHNKMKFAFDGVFVADDSRFALINKKTMQVGDDLNGKKIIAINADSVTLQGLNGMVELQAGGTYLI